MPVRGRLFLNLWFNSAGTAPASWTKADDQAELAGKGRGDRARVFQIDYYERVARLASRARLDALFLADQPQLSPDPGVRPEYPVDPFVLLSAVTARVPDIGAIATGSTSFSHPYTIARQVQSANLLSGGRVGWNAVATFRSIVADNFGATIASHEERYARADEFVSVVRELWGSWRFPWADSVGESGTPYGETTRISHRGAFFDVAGPLNAPEHPDGPPVIAQAGGSEQGVALAARHADIVYAALHDKAGAVRFVKRVREKAAEAGRRAPVVMPSISPILVSTEAEIGEVFDAYESTLPPVEERIAGLGRLLGVDLDDVGPDAGVELDRLVGDAEQGWPIGVKQSIIDTAASRPMSYRELLRESSGVSIDTPESIARRIEDWWRSDAADGFTIIPQISPAHLVPIVDELVPLLQGKGVFPREYRESSLRRRFSG